jgi:predicted enzyme related to lactoylglutathione lyase
MYQSMMTFIYIEDLEEASYFFEKVLDCEAIYEPSWAKVYKVSSNAYIGVVDESKGSVKTKYKGGTLISLTVESISPYYEKIKAYGVKDLSEIKSFEEIGVRSFFFKGPGGYDFEIQMFVKSEIKKLFTKKD